MSTYANEIVTAARAAKNWNFNAGSKKSPTPLAQVSVPVDASKIGNDIAFRETVANEFAHAHSVQPDDVIVSGRPLTNGHLTFSIYGERNIQKMKQTGILIPALS